MLGVPQESFCNIGMYLHCRLRTHRFDRCTPPTRKLGQSWIVTRCLDKEVVSAKAVGLDDVVQVRRLRGWTRSSKSVSYM